MVIATGVTVKATHEGVILGPITDPHTTAHHTTETQAHTTTNKTLHTEDLHHTEVFQGSQFIQTTCITQHTTAKHHQNCLTAPTKQPGKTKTGNINKSPLMIHHPNTTALMNKPATQMMIYTRRALS